MAYVNNNNCPNLACPYCRLYKDDSTYNFDPDTLYMDNEEIYAWKYYNTTTSAFIKMFHPDDGKHLIKHCKTIARQFLDEVSNNDVLEATCAEFDRLYSYGCYLRQFIRDFIYKLNAVKEFSIISILDSVSVQTFYKYIQYAANIPIISVINTLYLKNRFDILEASRDDAYKSIEFDKNISNYLCYVFDHFINGKIPISVEMKEHLYKFFGADRILEVVAYNTTRAINDYLYQKFPSNKLAICLDDLPSKLVDLASHPIESLDDLPSKMQNLSCDKNKLMIYNSDDLMEKPFLPPSYMVMEDTIPSVWSFIDTSTSFKYLRQFTDSPNKKDILLKIYNKELNAMHYFYPELYSSIQQKIAEIYLV